MTSSGCPSTLLRLRRSSARSSALLLAGAIALAAGCSSDTKPGSDSQAIQQQIRQTPAVVISAKPTEAQVADLKARVSALTAHNYRVRDLGGGRLESSFDGFTHVIVGTAVAGGATDVRCIGSADEAETFARGGSRPAEE